MQGVVNVKSFKYVLKNDWSMILLQSGIELFRIAMVEFCTEHNN